MYYKNYKLLIGIEYSEKKLFVFIVFVVPNQFFFEINIKGIILFYRNDVFLETEAVIFQNK